MGPIANIRASLQQPSPLDRVRDHPVARQPGTEDLHLEAEEADVCVPTGRPSLQ